MGRTGTCNKTNTQFKKKQERNQFINLQRSDYFPYKAKFELVINNNFDFDLANCVITLEGTKLQHVIKNLGTIVQNSKDNVFTVSLKNLSKKSKLSRCRRDVLVHFECEELGGFTEIFEVEWALKN